MVPIPIGISTIDILLSNHFGGFDMYRDARLRVRADTDLGHIRRIQARCM